jgi:hypothetical protein
VPFQNGGIVVFFRYLFSPELSACFYVARIARNSLQTTTNKSAAQKQLQAGL